MSSADIEALDRLLREASTLGAIFGSLPRASAHDQRTHARKNFTAMAKKVHPDLVPASLKKRAGEIFQSLTTTWDKAEAAILDGTYEHAPAPLRAATFSLASSKAVYTLRETAFRSGTSSTIYQGVADGAITGPVLVKIARQPTSNPHLENEARILGIVQDAAPKSPIGVLSAYLPRHLDSFLVEDGARRLRSNAYSLRPGFVSVRDILDAFPRGSLAPQDAAWIARRVIAQALAAEVLGVVHGSIVPEHVLIHPLSREPLHIGWGTAQQTGAPSLLRPPPALRAYYPRDALDLGPASARTDVYMAATVVQELFGGDVVRHTLPKTIPPAITSLLQKCTASTPRSRPSGRDFLDEFTRLIRKEWGRTYRPLVLPVRSRAT